MELWQSQGISQTPTWPECSVPPKLPPHVKLVRNRSGRPYLYLMRNRGTVRAEKPIRLPDDHKSPEFWAEYSRLMGQAPVKVATDTVGHLIKEWQASQDWRDNKPSTQRLWRIMCGKVIPFWGTLPVRGIETKHVQALADTQTPATANNLLRCLNAMMGWSVRHGWRQDNPCREARYRPKGDGYGPWSAEQVEAARIELEPTRPDLWWAIALALYSGQRLGDCLAMRWDAINNGQLAVRQAKTGKTLLIAIHRDLAAVLDTIPRRAVTILTSADGTPWRGGFQTAWRAHKPSAVRDAGLVFHGLRKSAVVRLLEAGCTDAEVAAITGQSRQMVEHYAKQVNQTKLAASAILKWEESR